MLASSVCLHEREELHSIQIRLGDCLAWLGVVGRKPTTTQLMCRGCHPSLAPQVVQVEADVAARRFLVDWATP